jgi:tight adherence protein B
MNNLKKIFPYPLLNSVELSKWGFDALFYALAMIAYYQSVLLAAISVAIMVIIASKTTRYLKDATQVHLDGLIDFLNYINSNMAIGLGFESAIMACSENQKRQDTLASQAIHQLSNAIRFGVGIQDILESLYMRFPIKETALFTRLMTLSKESGANPSNIAYVTLDKLYLKYRIQQEVEGILFQKQLEMNILTLSPILIILFICSAAPDYLNVLYETLIGRIVMTFALALVIIMKLIAEKIVKFER